jgi:hypothetical protein
MINKIFGKWLVVKECDTRDRWGARYYECKCECGYVGRVRPDHLTKGKSRGCYYCNTRSTTHGYSRTSTYKIWQGMLTRCYNSKAESYYLYGERGISVCERWSKFEFFLTDMGECPKGMCLDRIDPDGNYELRNCRWTTTQENLKNRRTSKKHSDKYIYVKKSKLCEKCLNKFIMPTMKLNEWP